MNYISRIKIKGFKSFSHAEAVLPAGFVALAGPNGSGKSNVTDAIRFCLGETSLKALRAKRVSELVNINSSRAEVSLYIEGDQKFELRRQVSEDGKTAYWLDGKHSTLTNAMEVLRPHGLEMGTHNIVGQGQVQRIVEMNAKERRGIIDTVAGISEFEDKKKEALSELGRVDSKISEAKVVLAERGAYLAELEKEKDAALKHLDAKERLERARATLLDAEYKKLDAHFNELLKKKSESTAALEKLKIQLDALGAKKSDLDAKRQALSEKIGKSSEREQLLSQINSIKLQIGQLEARADENKKELERLDAQQGDLKSQKERIGLALEQMKSDLAATQGELSKSLPVLESAKKAAGLYEEQAKASEMGQAAAELEGALKTKASIEANLARLGQMVLQYEELARKSATEAQALVKEGGDQAERAEKLSKGIRTLTVELDSLFDREKKLNKSIPDLDRQLLDAKEKVAALRGSISPAAQNPALLLIASLKSGGMDGLFGTVSELVSVDEEHRVAVESAAGARLNYVVSDTLDTADRAIARLKAAKSGRASFIPLDSVVLRDSLSSVPSGALGRLIDFIQYAPQYDSAMRYVFEDTLLVSAVDSAKRIGVGKFRMVTLGGEVLERSGIISGGSSHTSLMARASLQKADASLESIKAERDEMYSKLYELREEMTRLRKQRADDELSLRAIEAQVGSVSQRQAQAVKLAAEEAEWKSKATEAKKESGQLASEQDALAKREQELKSRIAALEEKAEEQRRANKKKMDEAQEKYRLALESHSRLESVSQSKQNEINMLAAQLSELETAVKKLSSHAKAVRSQMEQAAAQEEKHRSDMNALEARLKEASATVEKYYTQMQALQGELNAIGKEEGGVKFQHDSHSKQVNDIEVKLAGAQARLVDVKAEWEKHRLVPLLEVDRNEAEQIVRQSEQALKDLGMVNLKAPEVFTQRKKELEDVQTRVSTLESERAAILMLMDEIETKKRNIFLETFKMVNTHFKKLFSMIYDGDGTLILDEPSNPLESGLSIRVRGSHDKKDKYLESMSGGEKSLLGLIFIFSLQMHKPSPFYILDEAEAALDKENAYKFADLVKQMSKGAQFLVVTHNDAVLSSADVVLGVTRTDDGSKIVGVQLTGGSPFVAKESEGIDGSPSDSPASGAGGSPSGSSGASPSAAPANGQGHSRAPSASPSSGARAPPPSSSISSPSIPAPGEAGVSGLPNPARVMAEAVVAKKKEKKR